MDSSSPPPADSPTGERRAPFLLRVSILLLALAAGLLSLWLLGFVLRDLGRVEAPALAELEREALDPALVAADRDRRAGLAAIQSDLARQREIQAGLHASIDNARGTIDQMLAIRRLALEKDLPWSDTERDALATAQERFLASQDQLDATLGRAAELEQRRHELEAEIARGAAELTRLREPVQAAHREALRRRDFRVAVYQLSFLVPVFLAVAWLVARRRRSLYRPLFLALLGAATWQLGAVIHEHFPAEFFKYLALGAGLTVVTAFLVALLRSAARPSGAVLLRRNREGYRRGECPRCAFPLPAAGPTAPGTCAACGLELFRPCPSCGEVRHSQLPHCASCGASDAA